MDFEKSKEIFDALFQDIDGRALSLEGRESQQLTSKSFVYGEVLFNTFVDILKEADPKPGDVFLDCGSGTGKAVFIAYFVYEFSKSVGVELLDSLYKASETVLNRFDNDFKPTLTNELGERQIKFIHGNMLDIDFSSVDVCFLPSTCFQEDLMRGLVEPMSTMKPGSRAFSMSKTMDNPAFDMYKEKGFDFSWGRGTIYYHRRK